MKDKLSLYMYIYIEYNLLNTAQVMKENKN